MKTTQTPRDAAADAATDDRRTALEIVTFRLGEGVETSAFLAAARDTEALLRDHGGLIRRNLASTEDGNWTDVIEWASMDAALSAARAVMSAPAFAPFAAMIDPTTVEMRHAHVRWGMG